MQDEQPNDGSEPLALNGSAPLASLRLAQLATKDNILVSLATVIALDYFGVLGTLLAAVPC